MDDDTEPRTEAGDIDPQRIGADIEKWGLEWAQANHTAALLEKSAKAVFAELVAQHRAREPGMRRADAEGAALTSDVWQDHTFATADARLKANVARVRYDAARARFEALRTAEATRRAEMQTLGRR